MKSARHSASSTCTCADTRAASAHAAASASVEQGLLSCGYACYRELRTRDAHFDVGRAWQTAYMSPNEGGSGASTPLFVDFCLVMLGWGALARIAASPAGDLSYAGEA